MPQEDKRYKLYDCHKGDAVTVSPGPQIFALEHFDPRASDGKKRTITILDANKNYGIAMCMAPDDPKCKVDALVFVFDSSVFATAAADKIIRFYHTMSGRLINQMELSCAAKALVFSRDSKMLVAGLRDGIIIKLTAEPDNS